MNNKEYLEKDIKKHKPKLFMPIINTIIGVAFIILMIRVTIYNNVNPWFLVLVIILMLIFIGGSWFTSFFFKKKNKNLTKDFEAETELLFKAMYELKKGTFLEPKEPLKFEILDKYQNIEKVSFDTSARAFKPKGNIDIFINMGPSCAGLMVDYNTLLVKSFEGMSPNSIWKKKTIKLPEYKDGSLKLKMENYNKIRKLTLKILNQTDLYYDTKSGIYLTGILKRTPLDENIRIGENVIVSLFENEIQAVYVILDKDLFKKRKSPK